MNFGTIRTVISAIGSTLGWVRLVIVALLAGCIQPSVVACGDGTACPVDYTCSASWGCLSPDQRTACDGIASGEICTLQAIEGRCSEGGCIVAQCGNGVVEPGEACDDGNSRNGDGCSGRCDSDESCGNGIAELDEECDCGDDTHPGSGRCAGTFNGGTVCGATCRLRRCGDGIVDPGEVCDDGNTVPGDGCNFDCSSNETCGNGIVDYFAGEQCDDGNRRSRDGCAATCKTESLH